MRTLLRVTIGALVVLPLVVCLALVVLSTARDEPRRFEPVVIEPRAEVSDGQRFTRRSGDPTGRGAGPGPRPDDGGRDTAPEQDESPGDNDDGVAVVGPGPTRVDDDDDGDDDGDDGEDGEGDDTDD